MNFGRVLKWLIWLLVAGALVTKCSGLPEGFLNQGLNGSQFSYVEA
jgi:hypothetical protein